MDFLIGCTHQVFFFLVLHRPSEDSRKKDAYPQRLLVLSTTRRKVGSCIQVQSRHHAKATAERSAMRAEATPALGSKPAAAAVSMPVLVGPRLPRPVPVVVPVPMPVPAVPVPVPGVNIPGVPPIVPPVAGVIVPAALALVG